MRKTNKSEPRYFVYSIEKGFQVLQILTSQNRPLPLSDIAGISGFNNTTTTRICHTLCELGFIERDKQKLYKITPKILTLGYPSICGLDWTQVARYYLEQLYEEIQETVNLTILDGAEIFFLVRIVKKDYLSFNIGIGTRLPAFCTATGKAILSMGEPEKMQRVIRKLNFRPVTPHTIISLEKFMKEMEKIRKEGYATDHEELSVGLRVIAVPILNKHGYAVAAISVAVSTAEYGEMDIEERFTHRLLEVSLEITEALKRIEASIIIGD